jgi:hypothetical protein
MTKDKLIICKWCREQWHYFYVGDRMGFLKRHQDKVIKDSIERILALQESRRLMALADKLDKEAIHIMPTEDEDTLHAEQLYRQAIERDRMKGKQ